MARRRGKKSDFGNVRALASGRFQARYRGPDHQLRPAPYTFASESEAWDYLAEIKAMIKRGTWVDPARRKELLKPFAEKWVANRQLAVRTRREYEDLLRLHIVPQLGRMPVGAVTPDEVERWYRGRLASTGRTRTRTAYRLLRAILNKAVQDGLLPVNPCQIRGGGTVPPSDRPYVPPEHVDAIVAVLPEHMKTAVILTALAHLRKGELLGLRRGDVDLERQVLRVERTIIQTKTGPQVKDTPKGGKARTVHLPPEAVEALRAHLVAQPGLPTAPLFIHPNGKALQVWHVDLAWKRARSAAGFAEYHFHDLRHAGLTWFAQAGATLDEIRERGGHSTHAAALRYQHAAQERMKTLANTLSIKRSETA